MRGQVQRYQAHRSTLIGGGGIALMAVGILLTLGHVGGNVLPTVLGLLGFLMLNVGIAIGALLVVETRRYRQDQPYDDSNEEDDE